MKKTHISDLVDSYKSKQFLIVPTISDGSFDFAIYHKYKILGFEFKGKLFKKISVSFGRMIQAESTLNSISSPDMNFGREDKVNFLAYREYVMKGFNENSTGTSLDKAHAALSVMTEFGEACDHVKKDVFHKAKTDKVEMTSELGDGMWGLIALMSLYDISMVDVLRMNKAKLDHRYPNGRKDLTFRDKNAEYDVMKSILK